jgi:hypothetical protein
MVIENGFKLIYKRIAIANKPGEIGTKIIRKFDRKNLN